jgi:hypothetical protein
VSILNSRRPAAFNGWLPRLTANAVTVVCWDSKYDATGHLVEAMEDKISTGKRLQQNGAPSGEYPVYSVPDAETQGQHGSRPAQRCLLEFPCKDSNGQQAGQHTCKGCCHLPLPFGPVSCTGTLPDPNCCARPVGCQAIRPRKAKGRRTTPVTETWHAHGVCRSNMADPSRSTTVYSLKKNFPMLER